VAKKRKATRKQARTKKASPKLGRIKKADASRLDTGPLQEHIRKRIKELGGTPRTAAARAASAEAPSSDSDTVERLQLALETLEAICFPSMTIPI
jgi:hypothetical protein